MNKSKTSLVYNTMLANDLVAKNLYDTTISQIKSHDSRDSQTKTLGDQSQVQEAEELQSSQLDESQVVSNLNLTPPHQTDPTQQANFNTVKKQAF